MPDRTSPMPRSVMLAAGGTGGHLFPAFALAEELGRRGIAVDLVTDMRADRYDAGFPAREVYRVASASPSARSPLALARAVWSLTRGTAASLRLLRKVKPSAVVGFGGYPAFPPLVAARLLGVPTALHEQNAVLGRANRALARLVTVIATSFEHTKFLDGPTRSKARVTGNPVRDLVVAWASSPFGFRCGSSRITMATNPASASMMTSRKTVPLRANGVRRPATMAARRPAGTSIADL